MKKGNINKKVMVAMSPHKSLRDSAGQAGGDSIGKKVLVAMSGGVDSSVAAKLLIDRGYDVVGVFLHFWKEEINPINPPFKRGTKGVFENKCRSLAALNDARAVCRKLGIRLYTLNFSKQFKDKVVDNFLSQYKKGQTPNPCIVCNKKVKLGLLIKYAKKLGFDYVATGHYARLRREILNPKSEILNKSSLGYARNKQIQNKIQYKLYKAKDKLKDQSYFLYSLNQDELKHLLFPLGNYTKLQVRKIAKKAELAVANKKASQEICFIREKTIYPFLKRQLKLKPGLIQIYPPDKGGRGVIIGQHQGLPLYTIGQRKGLAIGGTGPYYALKKYSKTNTLYVVKNGKDKNLYSDILTAVKLNWLNGQTPKFPLACQAVIRYHSQPVSCIITPSPYLPAEASAKAGQALPLSPAMKDGANKGEKKSGLVLYVKFSKPLRAITSGQSVVFYKNHEVLGGGVIK